MLRLLRNRKAQNTMEYALIIAVVIGAFTAMQLYVRRGINARVRDGVNNIPGMVLNQEADQAKVQGLFTAENQYEPYYYREGSSTLTRTSSEGTERGIVTNTGGQRDLAGATSAQGGGQMVTGTNPAD